MKQNIDIMTKDSNGGPLIPKSRDLPLHRIDPQKNLWKISTINFCIPYRFKKMSNETKCWHPDGQGFERGPLLPKDSNGGPLIPKSRDLPLDQIDPQKNLWKISPINCCIPYRFWKKSNETKYWHPGQGFERGTFYSEVETSTARPNRSTEKPRKDFTNMHPLSILKWSNETKYWHPGIGFERRIFDC